MKSLTNLAAKVNWTKVIWLFPVFFILILGYAFYHQEQRAYETWSRINPQYNLTYSEWSALSTRNALPIQANVTPQPETK